MSKKRINEVILEGIKFDIVESNEVDGVHVLAKIRGPFFVPNGTSRNKRFYPAELWERIINDPLIQRKLENRLMFGTIGHDGELGDKGLRIGNGALIMTKIWVENNMGMGEALIIATPVGKILNTVLRAGSKLSVSSRANGTYEGKTESGLPIVSPKTYELEGWDVVIDPGFLEARPEIAESLENEIVRESKLDPTTKSEENIMNEKLIEKVCETNDSLQKQLDEAIKENKELKAENLTVVEENKNANEQLAELDETKNTLASYQELGSLEELKETKTKVVENDKVIASLLEHGESVEEIIEALTNVATLIDFIESEVTDFDGLKNFVAESKEQASKLEEMGGLDKVVEALKIADEMLENAEKEKLASTAKKIAEELKISEEKVLTLFEKGLTEEEIKDMYEGLTESKSSDADRYKKVSEGKKKKKSEEEEEEDDSDKDEDEDGEDEDGDMKESYTSSILGRAAKLTEGKKSESSILSNKRTIGQSISESLK